MFGKNGRIIKVVSNSSEITNDELKDSNTFICPAAIQSLPEIYKEIEKSNLLNKTIFGVFI